MMFSYPFANYRNYPNYYNPYIKSYSYNKSTYKKAPKNANVLKDNSENTSSNINQIQNKSQKRNRNQIQNKNQSNYNNNKYLKDISINKKTDESSKRATKSDIFSSNSEAFFEILGIKLYFDDILLICLIFFLYQEGVQDQYLFIALILLLLS